MINAVQRNQSRDISLFQTERSSRPDVRNPAAPLLASVGRQSSLGVHQQIFSYFDAMADAVTGTFGTLVDNASRLTDLTSSLEDLRDALGGSPDPKGAGKTTLDHAAFYRERSGSGGQLDDSEQFETRDVFEQRDVTESRTILGTEDVFETRDRFEDRDVFESRDVFTTRDVMAERAVYTTQNITEQRDVFERRATSTNVVAGTRTLWKEDFESAGDAGFSSGTEFRVRVGNGPESLVRFQSDERIRVTTNGVTTNFSFSGEDGRWLTRGLVSALDSIAGLDAAITSDGKLKLTTTNGEALSLSNSGTGNPVSRLGFSAGTYQPTTTYQNVKVGTEQVVVGTKQVQTGTEQVKVGTEQVKTGTEQVKVGTERVLVGTEQVKTGTRQVVVGVEDVVIGQELVKVGTEQVRLDSVDPDDARDEQSGVETYLAGFRRSPSEVSGSPDYKKISEIQERIKALVGDSQNASNLLAGSRVSLRPMMAFDDVQGADFSLEALGLDELGSLDNPEKMEQAIAATDAALEKAQALQADTERAISYTQVLNVFGTGMSGIWSGGTAPVFENGTNDDPVEIARTVSEQLKQFRQARSQGPLGLNSMSFALSI